MDRTSERLHSLRATGVLGGPPEEAFERLTDLTRKLLNAPVALISLVDEDRQFCVSASGLAEPWASARETAFTRSFCKHVVDSAAPLVIEDARRHPVACETASIDDLEVEAYLGIPLLAPDGAAIGSLCAIDTRPRSWSDVDVDMLSALAGSVMAEIAARVSVLERTRAELALREDIEARKRAEADLHARIRELELLYQLSTEVTRARSTEEIYDRALHAVLESLQTTRASLLLFDPDDVMRFKAWEGLSDRYRAAVEGHTPWTPNDADAVPVMVEDVRSDPSLRDFMPTFSSEGIASMIFVPLIFERRVLGKFMAYFGRPRSFTDEEIRLVQTVANHVAFAIDRQSHETRLRRLNETLEDRVRDRTRELMRANEELRQRNYDLQSFAHIASHDLQEPLRKISSFADLMMADYADRVDETGRMYLERMQSSAVRMSHLLSDLLQYSRVATDRRGRGRVDLNGVVEDVLADLHLQISEASARVESGPLPAVDADPTQMRQLFQNLISNAIKYRRDNVEPRIRIAVEDPGERTDEGDFCTIMVADNGIGFDEKYADRIFLPFQRLYRGKYPGSGMGLAICRRIVEAHRGSIAVRSTAGEGSTFIVHLPTAVHVET